MTKQIISARAEVRRNDYYFSREQSRTMRDAQWSSRARPLRWWRLREWIKPRRLLH